MTRSVRAWRAMAVAIVVASAAASAQSREDRVREVVDAARPTAAGPLQRQVVPLLLLSYAREQLDRHGQQRGLGLAWSLEAPEWRAVEDAAVEHGATVASRTFPEGGADALTRCLRGLSDESLDDLVAATRSAHWAGYLKSLAATRAAMVAMSDVHPSLLATRDALVEKIVVEEIPEELPPIARRVNGSACIRELATASASREQAALNAQGALLASIQAESEAAARGFEARVAREGPSRGHLVREVVEAFRPAHPTTLQAQLPFLALAGLRLSMADAGSRLGLGPGWNASSADWADVEALVNAQGFAMMKKPYGIDAGQDLARCAEGLSVPDLEALVQVARDPDWALYKKVRDLEAALAALDMPVHPELAGTRHEMAERMRHRLAHLPGAMPDVRRQTRRIASALRIAPCRDEAVTAIDGGDRRALQEMRDALRELAPRVEEAARRFRERSQGS